MYARCSRGLTQVSAAPAADSPKKRKKRRDSEVSRWRSPANYASGTAFVGESSGCSSRPSRATAGGALFLLLGAAAREEEEGPGPPHLLSVPYEPRWEGSQAGTRATFRARCDRLERRDTGEQSCGHMGPPRVGRGKEAPVGRGRARLAELSSIDRGAVVAQEDVASFGEIFDWLDAVFIPGMSCCCCCCRCCCCLIFDWLDAVFIPGMCST